MRDILTARLAALQAEHATGLQQLAQLDRDRQAVWQATMQIEGAIALCEELLALPQPEVPAEPGEPGTGAPPARAHRRTRPLPSPEAADASANGTSPATTAQEA